MLRGGAPKASYGTVTSASSTADVLIAFAPEAKLAEVSALLQANRATIVGGPRGGGLYELRVGEKPPSKSELEAVLKTLSASPLVKLALPGTAR